MTLLRSVLLAFLMMPVLLIHAQKVTHGQKSTHGQPRDGLAMIDTTVIGDVLRVKLDGVVYTGRLKQDSFYMQGKKGRVVMSVHNDYYSSFVFRDYDGDGYKDLLLEMGGNTPGQMDVYLYSPAHRGFKKLKDAREFPAPEKIKGTPYYYSYHHSGCADENWDSDLFYIHNDAAVCLGNIYGDRCSLEGIYISRVRSGKKQLMRKMPLEIIHRYKCDKWGFIEAYWKKYYRSFI